MDCSCKKNKKPHCYSGSSMAVKLTKLAMEDGRFGKLFVAFKLIVYRLRASHLKVPNIIHLLLHPSSQLLLF